MTTIKVISPADLSVSSFSNDNTSGSGGIKIRTNAGSAVGDAITTALAAVPDSADTVKGKVALNLGTAAGDAANATDALTAAGLAAMMNGTAPNASPNALQAAVNAVAGAVIGSYTTNPTAPNGATLFDQANRNTYLRIGGAWVRTSLAAGIVQHFYGDGLPAGYLALDPILLHNQSDYPELAATFGVTSGTFSLVDGRSEFLRGLDNGRGVDAGRVARSHQLWATQSHGHQLTGAGITSLSGGAGAVQGGIGGPNFTGPYNQAYAGPLIQTTAGVILEANETRPRNLALTLIVKI